MKYNGIFKSSILLSCVVVSISSGVLWKPVLMPLEGIAKFLRDINEEIKFRHYTVVQYRDQVSLKFSNAIDKFSKLQVTKSNDAVQDIESYVKQFHQVYDETVNLIEQQKKIINDLDLKIINRPAQFYESLDRFRKSYDESISKVTTIVTPPSISIDARRKASKTSTTTTTTTTKQKPQKMINKKKRSTTTTIDTTTTNFFDRLSNSLSVSQTNELLNTKSFHQQIEIIKNILGQEVKTVTQQILDPIMTNRMDANIQILLQEFHHIQDDISQKASLILNQSQQAIAESINKKDVLQEKIELEKNLKILEKNFNMWIDENKANLEEKLNAIKDKISITNTLYEEIIGRKKVELEIQEMNDRMLRKVLNMIDPNAPGWTHLSTSEEGFNVYRQFLSGTGSQYACVMCNGTIQASPEHVFKLLDDPNRVREYNTLYNTGRDVAVIDDNTRIVHSFSFPVFPMKERDFCTIIHVRKLKDGTSIILNRATDHPAAPTTSQYVRGSILLAANIIQPIPRQPNKCKLTMITQLNPGGFAPPPIINYLCSQGPVGFMKNVEAASKRRGGFSNSKVTFVNTNTNTNNASSKNSSIRSVNNQTPPNSIKKYT